MRPTRQQKGKKAYRYGHRAEWLAALFLMVRGYRLIGFRLKTPLAEIDLLAVKDKTLIVFEVKSSQRSETLPYRISKEQLSRLFAAGDWLKAKKQSLKPFELRLEALYIDLSAPWSKKIIHQKDLTP